MTLIGEIDRSEVVERDIKSESDLLALAREKFEMSLFSGKWIFLQFDMQRRVWQIWRQDWRDVVDLVEV